MISTQKISLNTIIVQSEGNVVSDMDGEKVMLSIKNGKYYNLGKLGGDIWELVNSPIQINSLIEILVSQYDIEKTECEQDVLSFINHLNNENLIQIMN